MSPLRRALVALTITLGGAGAPGPPMTPIVGDWSGSYRCVQGLTALHLTVDASQDGTLHAIFAFSGLPSTNDVPPGSFQMQGAFDPASQTATLQPRAWLVHPVGYMTVGLNGKLDCSGTRFRGRIVGGVLCSTFELFRPGAAGCEHPASIS